MIMKYKISSALICGAALSVLLAVTPAFSRVIEPDELYLGSLVRLPPSAESLPLPKKKKKPSMHTVQEDSIIINPRVRFVQWPVPTASDWGLTPDSLDIPDWIEATGDLDLYRPDLVPFQMNLSLAADAGDLVDLQELAFATIYGLPPAHAAPGAPLIGEPVPAPGALALLALGAGAMLGGRRRR